MPGVGLSVRIVFFFFFFFFHGSPNRERGAGEPMGEPELSERKRCPQSSRPNVHVSLLLWR
eukprot:7380371-Prymnesium_polylepis.1